MKFTEELKPQFYFTDADPVTTFTVKFEVELSTRSTGFEVNLPVVTDITGVYQDVDGNTHNFKFDDSWTVKVDISTPHVYYLNDLEIDFRTKTVDLY